MKRIAALITFVLLSACAEAPRILVDACAASTETAGELVGGIDDCVLFVEAAVGVPTTTIVRAMNPSNEPLTLTSVTLAEGSDPIFAIATQPEVIPPGESADIAVVVRPATASTTRAELVIRSDAANASEIAVVISVSSIDAGLPDIEVSPIACEFGDVSIEVAETDACTISLSNNGVRDLIIDSVVIADCDETCAFRLVQPLGRPALPPNTVASLDLFFRPQSVGQIDSVLSIFTNDPDESPFEVALSAVVVP